MGQAVGRLTVTALWTALFLVVGCNSSAAPTGAPSATTAPGEQAAGSEGEVVTPPFAVAGEAQGLLLVWFDESGPHSASQRADVPEAHRQFVRVDSLSIAPEQRLDPDFVYVADLRAPAANGRYTVRKILREAFDARIDAAQGEQIAAAPGAGSDNPSGGQDNAASPSSPPSTGSADVILYMASWCGACRQAAQFFRERGVAFVEKDIERDRTAYAEMHRKAQAAGLRPQGVPVIDFRGTILLGFDRARIERLIGRTGTTI